MSTSQNRPATHAGPWNDLTARETVSTPVQGRIAWRPEEELAMERAVKRSRIACIDFLNITVEIRRQPRSDRARMGRIGRAAQRARRREEIARDQTLTHARWMLHR